jgi:hypothetical protein
MQAMGDADRAEPPRRGLIGRLRLDASCVSLIAANLVTVVVAVAQGWEPADVLWVYWGQNCAIGFFSYLRMFKVENGCLFPLHFACFQFIYFLAIRDLWAPATGGWWLVVCVGAFLANHAFSFVHNFRRDRSRGEDGRAMIFPYIRIFPMHATVVGAAFLATGTATVVAFLLLKTVADLAMHLLEHAEHE